MQPLIHKALVHLTIDKLPKAASPSDEVSLYLQQDGQIIVTYMVSSRLPFGLGGPVELVLGYLGNQATAILRPALERYAYLRVRIVEILPAHLSASGNASLFISVWGDPTILWTAQPKLGISTQGQSNAGRVPEDEG